jgi:hypothetical protein
MLRACIKECLEIFNPNNVQMESPDMWSIMQIHAACIKFLLKVQQHTIFCWFQLLVSSILDFQHETMNR